ncbi:MAG: hypothetical protein IH991_06200, partial [Planctomycetes bacterium]|nr:hypothetical protein [Planctomycetota bacterium]
ALNGKLAERAIRRAIQSGGLDANAELTIMIKGSSKPLVDSGVGLFQAITSKVLDERTVFAGVLRTEAKFNIAIALHEGTEIKVTPAMRGMFFWLWQASIGAIPSSRLEGRASELWERAPGGWAPLKEGTSHIIIPSRPFMKQAFADGALKRKAKENWQMAVKKTMRELAQ